VTQPSTPLWRQRFTAATVSFPAWSEARPDRLWFTSDESGSMQGWVLETGSGSRRQITDQTVGVESLVVTPDGSGAAWWSDDTGDENGAWVVTAADGSGQRRLLPDLPTGWSQGLSMAGTTVAVGLADEDSYRVYVSDTAAGAPTRLVYESTSPAGIGREWEQTSGGLCTDGSLLCVRQSEQGDILHFGLRVVEVASGATVGDLLDQGLTLRVAAWSPVAGDQRLALVHERDGIERPAVWDLGTGERRDYPLDLPGPVDVAGWWPDGSALLLLHEHEARRQAYRLEASTGSLTLVHDPGGWISAAAVRPDGEVWLREESPERPARIRTLDGREVLAAPGERPAPGRPHRSVTFEGPAGPTHLLLTLPDGPPPYPTVLMVHGGPEWAYPDELDPWEQALAEHGYAVVKVNYRGSTGSTVAWRTALHGGNIGLPEVADVVAGLEHLVAEGVVDPARVAIEGWSWGGYVTLLAAGLHPELFAAAVAGIPVCDSVMCHEDCSPPQQAYDLAIMGGSPTDLPDLYAERSPITYVDRVRAPILIIAGEHDSACPVRQVRHYIAAREALGGAIEAHIYPAGHHANSVAEQLLHAELALAFLARHLVSAGPDSTTPESRGSTP
jgi:dipeptidyl aminopeptidase/acylaminoacyl peptidase